MVLLVFILAHLLADFVFQPGGLVSWKTRSWKGLFVHATIHFLMNVILLALLGIEFGANVMAVCGGIAFLHFGVDAIKINYSKKNRSYVEFFFLDQITHLFVLLGATFCLKNFGILLPGNEGWRSFLFQPFFLFYLIAAILITYCIEIVRFQILMQKNYGEKVEPLRLNYRAMLGRLLIFTVLYGIFFFTQNASFGL